MSDSEPVCASVRDLERQRDRERDSSRTEGERERSETCEGRGDRRGETSISDLIGGSFSHDMHNADDTHVRGKTKKRETTIAFSLEQ